jgi:hypothetical protein
MSSLTNERKEHEVAWSKPEDPNFLCVLVVISLLSAVLCYDRRENFLFKDIHRLVCRIAEGICLLCVALSTLRILYLKGYIESNVGGTIGDALSWQFAFMVFLPIVALFLHVEFWFIYDFWKSECSRHSRSKIYN